jgi:hypothetical protein
MTDGPKLERGRYASEQTRDAVVQLMCDELEKGLSIRVTCDKIGIDSGTYYRWKRKAEQGEERYIAILRKLKAARARGFETRTGRIHAIAEHTDDWRAHAWLVDKLYPGWGGGEEIAFTPDEGSPLQGYATPERLLGVVRFAVQSGVVTPEQLAEWAPQQAAIEPPQQPAITPLLLVRQAAWVALRQGPQDVERLTTALCAAYKVAPDVVTEATDMLGVQLLDAGSPGLKPRWQLPENPPDPVRALQSAPTPVKAEDPGVEPVRMPATAASDDGRSTAEDTRVPPEADAPEPRGNWFDGPDVKARR